MMNYGQKFMTLETGQDHPPRKEMQKRKMAVWGGFTNSCEKKRSKAKEKRKDKHLSAGFQRIARRDKKAFPSYQCKKREEQNGKD